MIILLKENKNNMSTYRLTFNFEVPDLSEDDRREMSGWLDHFIGCVEDDIYSCCPHGGMNVSSNWEEIYDCEEI